MAADDGRESLDSLLYLFVFDRPAGPQTGKTGRNR
jgi:hypothetical protein